ncbi:helix-turn-helix domain-containing protein [Nocardia sp. NPDC002869]|uniref:AraC family transcriptional regulator n=1 Tax=Nocardia sp. NPDC002869 TaxID=3161032 RepID=UPI00398CD2B8
MGAHAPVFDSADLDEVRAFLDDAYPGVRFGRGGAGLPMARVRRDVLGSTRVDRLELRFDLPFTADRSGELCVAGVRRGAIDLSGGTAGADSLAAGSSGLLTAVDHSYAGVMRAGCYDVVVLDAGALDRLAGTEDGTPVRVTGARPVTPAAGHHLSAVITHLRDLAADPSMVCTPLVAATATDYLAATVLKTLPTTASPVPGAADRDAHPRTVRRAMAYLESHLHDRVTLAAVAAAAYVTPRALQMAFRAHLDTTPLEYLRRRRLAGAHEQLTAAVPGDGQTVTSIARRWGFTHPGRFAAAYRRHYHRSPAQDLRA